MPRGGACGRVMDAAWRRLRPRDGCRVAALAAAQLSAQDFLNLTSIVIYTKL
jgi:hypothetical protein